MELAVQAEPDQAAVTMVVPEVLVATAAEQQVFV